MAEARKEVRVEAKVGGSGSTPKSAHEGGKSSLIPRPLPRFYLAAMEKNLPRGCKIKSGLRPGNEARAREYDGMIVTVMHRAPVLPLALLRCRSLHNILNRNLIHTLFNV